MSLTFIYRVTNNHTILNLLHNLICIPQNRIKNDTDIDLINGTSGLLISLCYFEKVTKNNDFHELFTHLCTKNSRKVLFL